MQILQLPSSCLQLLAIPTTLAIMPWHEPYRKNSTKQFHLCCMIIHCHPQVFIEPLPSKGQCSNNHVTILFPRVKVYVFFELLFLLFKNSPICVCVFKTVLYIQISLTNFVCIVISSIQLHARDLIIVMLFMYSFFNSISLLNFFQKSI